MGIISPQKNAIRQALEKKLSKLNDTHTVTSGQIEEEWIIQTLTNQSWQDQLNNWKDRYVVEIISVTEVSPVPSSGYSLTIVALRTSIQQGAQVPASEQSSD